VRSMASLALILEEAREELTATFLGSTKNKSNACAKRNPTRSE
jgi:hypothetical protein